MYRLTKVVNIWDEFDCGNFETKEKAIKKMNFLIKKKLVKQTTLERLKRVIIHYFTIMVCMIDIIELRRLK